MILYHYCSNDSFCKIIQSRSIWLSLLGHSNDYLEGKWVHELVRNSLKEAENLSASEAVEIMDLLDRLFSLIPTVGFCLSEEKDLLSQWRGYADDGCGVSIGFNADYLAALATTAEGPELEGKLFLERIEYDKEKQLEMIKPIVSGVCDHVADGALKGKCLSRLMEEKSIEIENKKRSRASAAMTFEMMRFLPIFYTLKNPAFKEEKEYRICSHVTAQSEHIKNVADVCQYRAYKSRIIPYIPIGLRELSHRPVEEVIVGPKNQTPSATIEKFLRKHGFNDVSISRSDATYR